MFKMFLALVVGLIIGLSVNLAPKDASTRQQHSLPRSGKWPTARQNHLRIEPECAICGSRDKLEVHHIESFHDHPDKELDPNNLITLCANASCKSHLTIGHLGSYLINNPNIREDAALLKKRRLLNKIK